MSEPLPYGSRSEGGTELKREEEREREGEVRREREREGEVRREGERER